MPTTPSYHEEVKVGLGKKSGISRQRNVKNYDSQNFAARQNDARGTCDAQACGFNSFGRPPKPTHLARDRLPRRFVPSHQFPFVSRFVFFPSPHGWVFSDVYVSSCSLLLCRAVVQCEVTTD